MVIFPAISEKERDALAKKRRTVLNRRRFRTGPASIKKFREVRGEERVL